jgi:hypothetical protein
MNQFFAVVNVLCGSTDILRRPLSVILGMFKFHDVSESGFVSIKRCKEPIRES